jgi:hypothetical protein
VPWALNYWGTTSGDYVAGLVVVDIRHAARSAVKRGESVLTVLAVPLISWLHVMASTTIENFAIRGQSVELPHVLERHNVL